MNKTGLTILAILAGGVAAYAQMDDQLYAFDVSASGTVSKVYTLRGDLEAIQVKTASGGAIGEGTNVTLSVTSAELTLFSLAAIGNVTNTYLPRYATHTSAGAAATFNSHWSTNTGVTSSEAQTWYSKAPLAGPVTVSIGNLTHASPTVTNRFEIKLIYRK
jgi:hypothetical protein